MSNIKHTDPSDEENSHISHDSQDEEDNEIWTLKKPGRDIAILMVAYWLAWLVTVVAKVLIAIQQHIWEMRMYSESRIIDYIFMNHIYQLPYGGFYIADNFYRTWSSFIAKALFISSTICTIAQVALTQRLQPFKNDVSDALVIIWMTLGIIAASYARLTPKEGASIMIPFSWLSAKTVELLCSKRGISPAKVSEKKAMSAQMVSMILFFSLHVKVLGVRFDGVVLGTFFNLVVRVWMWSRTRSREEQGMEKA